MMDEPRTVTKKMASERKRMARPEGIVITKDFSVVAGEGFPHADAKGHYSAGQVIPDPSDTEKRFVDLGYARPLSLRGHSTGSRPERSRTGGN